MDQYEHIRTAHRRYGKSIRQIRREMGHHRQTIRKALAGQEPRYRRQQPAAHPVMDPVAEIVESWLRADEKAPRKQRHTARRIWKRLRQEHRFEGGESTVRRWVRQWKARHGQSRVEAVLPLDPEAAREAEVDWGTAWVEMAGQRQRVKLFAMRGRRSGKPFARAYPWERQEMFLDAHLRAFDYYQGVYPELVYDNLTAAVKRILRGRRRIEQERFLSFRRYYTFQARFCTPAAGREKGGVEGLIGFARRNFLVPLPRVADFAELNQLLLERCQAYDGHRIAGREDRLTVGERFEAERKLLLKLPERPFENFQPMQVKVDAYQTARVDRNRYSVPRQWVGRRLWAHLGCETVRLHGEGRLVAEHRRLFSNSQWQLDPLHYLELLEQRVGAFEVARPIRQWRPHWPADYETLLERLRQRHGPGPGTRQFVGVLRLHEEHGAARVQECVAEALERQCADLESIRQLLHRQASEPWSGEVLETDRIPGVTDQPRYECDLSGYDALLPGGAL